MYKVLGAERCSSEDTQQLAAAVMAASQAAHSQPIRISHPPSVSLLYTVVNEEVEQQFLGRGLTL
jgi:hypothetical protein